MKPFLRPATPFGITAKPTPDGWDSRTIGRWRGRPVEVVFDPRENDVALVQTRTPAVTAALVNAGWQRCGRDGRQEWWIRDRVAAARTRLDRAPRATTTMTLAR